MILNLNKMTVGEFEQVDKSQSLKIEIFFFLSPPFHLISTATVTIALG